MQSILDDVARILATPAPRRQALKMAAGIFAGGVLAAFGVKQARAQDTAPAACKPGTTVCGKKGLCCATATQKCCITASRGAFCVPKAGICCGNTACGPKTVCCHGVCCSPGQTCVNNRCSSSKAAA